MMKQWKQAGFSMIELLVGMAIGLFLLAAVLLIASNSGKTYRGSNAESQLQDNGLYATQYLARAIRGAGFFGCINQRSAITNNLNNSSSSPYNFTGNSSISGADIASGSTGPLAGTDTITVQGATTQAGIAVVAPYANGTSVVVAPSNKLRQSQVILISDCQAGDIFQINNNNSSSGLIGHDTGGGVTPGNATNTLSKNYQGGSYLYVMNSDTFSIQTGSNGRPSLFRTGLSGTTELVPGIENLQVSYGEDTDADGIANHYVNASSVANMANVVSIRFSLVSVSNTDQLLPAPQSYRLNGQTITPTDKRIRRVYNSTISLRNRLS